MNGLFSMHTLKYMFSLCDNTARLPLQHQCKTYFVSFTRYQDLNVQV